MALEQSITTRMRGRGAVVVAQFVERSLPIPEVHGSNPVIGKKNILNIYYQLYWKDKNKENEARNGPFFQKQQ